MNRKKILKLLGMFLVLMLFCTILSRAASSVTVAQVNVTKPSNMIITHKVTATGKVEQDSEQAVSTQADQKVDKIYVHEGESVEAGDVLFQVNMDKLNEQILECRQELEKLNMETSDAESQKDAAQEKKSMAEQHAIEDYNLTEQKADQAVAWAEYELNRAQARLNEYYASTPLVQEDEGGADSEEALVDAVNTAQKAYDDAVLARTESLAAAEKAIKEVRLPEGNDSSTQIKAIDQEKQEMKLKKLQQLAKAKGEVTSPIKGVVTKINVNTGELTSEQAAMLLADMSEGCKFVAQVEKTQEKYLEKNASVVLENTGTKKTVEDLKIDNIEVNDENSELLDITVYVPADTMEIGTSAEMTVEKKSKTYSTCIPIQALYESAGEAFVYVLQETNSVLGEELTAMKVAVTVQDKNETYAALGDGSLSNQQQVIVSSDRNIDGGSRVRLKES